ncbi:MULTISPECIES: lysis system i-spanin subunit Rz [unclassified Ralstonia]|uniref:lysis system i-spanin subunit Rz n=1 Tax=unclassified Ralstonia TaxID=209769 RepID=UPI002C1BBA19|nr:lysis system i-spanin subunit Rz [Ralstonia sp.]HWV05012.1 lysis system i-spanin subunit Rz [Ralstonia sp.]
MNFAIVRLLAVAAVAAAAAWGWQANRYETTIAQMQRDHAIERQAAVDTVVTALQAAITKHRQLTDQLDALGRTHFSEMQRATVENTRMQHALAAGDVRMSVRARCQPDAGAGASEDQPGAGLGDGAAGRCELSGEDAADLVDLFAGAERDAEKLRYFQARERALEGAGVCVEP